MEHALFKAWKAAYLAFDDVSRKLQESHSDTQLDWCVALVGARRSSFWDGSATH